MIVLEILIGIMAIAVLAVPVVMALTGKAKSPASDKIPS